MTGWTRPDFIIAGRAWAEGHNTAWIAQALDRKEAEVWGRLDEIKNISRAFLGTIRERREPRESQYETHTNSP